MSISTVYDSTDLNAEWVHWRLFRKNKINRESGEIDFLLKVGRFMFHSKWGDLLFIQSGEIDSFFKLKMGIFTFYSKWGDLHFT